MLKKAIVGTFIVLMLISCCKMANASEKAGFGTFSEGYRIGEITKFSVKGLMTKSGEGQMLMGRESTPYIITTTDSEGNVSRKTINPWYFSAHPSKKSLLMPAIGSVKVVQYTQAQVRNPLAYDTDYMIQKVFDPISNGITSCEAENLPKASKSDGIRNGRLVKVSKKGHVNKTFEAMLQQGNAGNQFKNFTLYDEKMFDCATKILMSAQKVNVHYREMWFRVPFSADTNYAITKIEVPKKVW